MYQCLMLSLTPKLEFSLSCLSCTRDQTHRVQNTTCLYSITLFLSTSDRTYGLRAKYIKIAEVQLFNTPLHS